MKAPDIVHRHRTQIRLGEAVVDATVELDARGRAVGGFVTPKVGEMPPSQRAAEALVMDTFGLLRMFARREESPPALVRRRMAAQERVLAAIEDVQAHAGAAVRERAA